MVPTRRVQDATGHVCTVGHGASGRGYWAGPEATRPVMPSLLLPLTRALHSDPSRQLSLPRMNISRNRVEPQSIPDRTEQRLPPQGTPKGVPFGKYAPARCAKREFRARGSGCRHKTTGRRCLPGDLVVRRDDTQNTCGRAGGRVHEARKTTADVRTGERFSLSSKVDLRTVLKLRLIKLTPGVDG
jgi:hypothetical protein